MVRRDYGAECIIKGYFEHVKKFIQEFQKLVKSLENQIEKDSDEVADSFILSGQE